MKSFQLLLLCLVCAAISYGQGGRLVIEVTKGKHKSYTIKVIESVNPRADSSWLPSIEKDLNRSIPANKHIKKGKYIASARFITDKNGGINDVECIIDPGFGIGADLVRALKKSGKWVSAKGNIVRPYKH
jgi:protein TonB